MAGAGSVMRSDNERGIEYSLCLRRQTLLLASILGLSE